MKRYLAAAVAMSLVILSGCRLFSPSGDKAALVVIDIQNDYFPGGKFPLRNTDVVLKNITAAISKAREQGIPVVLIQHVGNPRSPFLAEGTVGVKIHPDICHAAPEAPVIVKKYADSFDGTMLQATLKRLGANKLLVCGMMTQNCVAFTAVSPMAAPYEVIVLTDACATVSEVIDKVALSALARRVKTSTTTEIFPK